MDYLAIPRRRCRERSVYTATLVALVFTPLLILINPAYAGEAYTKSESPVFPDVKPDRALVYFANDLFSSTAYVYLDTTAIGLLPRRSYTAALVKPGFRLVWGTAEAKWYEFKAGWAYLLRLVKVGTLSAAWVTDNPGIVRVLVSDKQLTYVAAHEKTLTRLQAKAQTGYKNALKRAGTELALPYRKQFHTLDLNGKSPASMQAER